MLHPIIMFVADDIDIFTVLSEVLDCSDYAVVYYIEQNVREAILQNGWADVAVVDLRGSALDQVAHLLAYLWQFPLSRTVPVIICADGAYAPTASRFLSQSEQHQWNITLLEPPVVAGQLLAAIQQRLRRMPV